MSDWQISGVTTAAERRADHAGLLSNNAGIQNSNPSLTDGITSRCMLVGDPFTLTPAQIEANKSLPFADQVHFNVAAFAMAQPLSPDVGQLRQHAGRDPAPSDVARVGPHAVTPVPRQRSWAGRTAALKLQVQAYNVFNEVQFTNMNATFTFTGANNAQNTNANTGKYTQTGNGLAAGTIAPR